MRVSKDQLRRIIQVAVRHKLGADLFLEAPAPVELKGQLTFDQMQGLIDEAFFHAMVGRRKLVEKFEDEDEDEEDDDMDQVTSYLEGETL